MDKQPRMIDADKLDKYLESVWNKRGRIIRDFIDALNYEIDCGKFDSDPIPLPTIKPGDKVQRKLPGLYLEVNP